MYLLDRVKKSYELKCSHEPAEAVKYLERNILLNAIDRLWQEHLYSMDSLREAVYLRAYGQKDPLLEYKTEAFDMFTVLMGAIKSEILHNLFRSTANLEAFGAFLQSLPQFLTHADETGAPQTERGGGTAVADRESRRAGANDPGGDFEPHAAGRSGESRTQRPVPVRQRKEV